MNNTDETGGANRPLKVKGPSPLLVWMIWLPWLIFLAPPIVTLSAAHPAPSRLIAILIGLAIFIALYMWASWRNVLDIVGLRQATKHAQREQWLFTVGLVVLSFALAALAHNVSKGNELLEPFIYTSAYVGGRFSSLRALLAVVVLIVLIIVGSWLIGISAYQVVQGLFYIGTVPIVVIGVVRSVTISKELRIAREEIARLAVESERLRIARDLHDLLGHNLSLIALKSELAGRLLKVSPERAATEIGDIENVSRTTLQEVREAVSNYRQPTLTSELHGAQEILTAAGIAYRVEGEGIAASNLPREVETLLSWAVREGVTNVIRHSRAHQCIIHLTRGKQAATIEVSNDGVDGTLDTGNGSNSSGGNGLRGLTERVMALGGQCESGPYDNGSFRLTVSVPLAQKNRQVGTPGNATVLQFQHSTLVSTASSNSSNSNGDEERSEEQ